MSQSDVEEILSDESEPSTTETGEETVSGALDDKKRGLFHIEEYISEDFSFDFQTLLARRKRTASFLSTVQRESDVESLRKYPWFSVPWDKVQREKEIILKTLAKHAETTLKIGEIWVPVTKLIEKHGNSTDIIFDEYLNSYFGFVYDEQVNDLARHHYSMNTSLNALVETLDFDRCTKKIFTS